LEMAWSAGPGYRGTREGCERVQDQEARHAGASGRARGGLGLAVGDGPDKRDPVVGEIDMEEGVELSQEKNGPSEGAR
jgi:hypothetical protein